MKGRDGAHLMASVKPFQTSGPEFEMHSSIYCTLKQIIVSEEFAL